MSFKKRKIKHYKFDGGKLVEDKKEEKYKYLKKKKIKGTKKLRNFILFSLLLVLIGGLSVVGMMRNKYIRPLPPIKEIDKVEIPEASIIYDREGNELYTLYAGEKRTYIGYDKISKNMVNAIVSGEDKRYWTNPGVDLIGLARAVIDYALGKNAQLQGTSTISQQLIRNAFPDIGNERKVERKIKEIYLSYQINRSKEYSKEKILELYLNKIPFGSNAYGIEQASKTFFAKPASELTILESSILASLPKGPTAYSPYGHYDKLVGYTYVYDKNTAEKNTIIITPKEYETYSLLTQEFKNIIGNITGKSLSDEDMLLCGIKPANYKADINIDNDGCIVIQYTDLLEFLNNIIIRGEDIVGADIEEELINSTGTGETVEMTEEEKLKNDEIKYSNLVLEYQIGRKDYILGRMLEDKYITFDEYKEALMNSFGFEFEEYREKIKYPYFVFYIKEYLEEKYGSEVVEKSGLKIYTSIDPKLQEKAEEIVKAQIKKNKEKIDAGNAALVSMDNETGQILAMVGGGDFFDTEHQGNVNMITSTRQPGSTFKPIVYSLALTEKQIGTNTPIYDLKTKFPGGYEPNNYDGKFNGKMTVMTALNYSRNIPAIKMYYLAGGQEKIIDYIEKLGIKSLDKNATYGAPLGIGTGELKPIELMLAYSTFANMGVKKDLVPVIKILDSDGIVLEEFKKNDGEKAISNGTAYIMNYMLSDSSTRPSFWNTYLSLKDRQVAAKTGTSNKEITKNGRKVIYPGDIWTAGYTPQITTVVWAGNTDGRAMNAYGNGLEGAGPIWRDFMEFAHEGKEKLTWQKPDSVSTASISKISGLLPPSGFNGNFITSSLFLTKNIPNKYDNSLKPIELDMLCNGQVTEDTPPAAIRNGYYVAFHSIDPTQAEWEKSVQIRANAGGATKEIGSVGNVITTYNPEPCKRDPAIASNIQIGSNVSNGENFINGYNYVEIGYKSNNPIIRIDVYIGANRVQEIPVNNQKQGVYMGTIKVPSGYYGEYDLKIIGVDNYYYSASEIKKINIINKDNSPPKISITNPMDDDINLYPGQHFNLRGTIDDRSSLRSVNIYLDGVPIKIGLELDASRSFNFSIKADDSLAIGNHKIKVEAIDFYFNKGEKIINLDVIQN